MAICIVVPTRDGPPVAGSRYNPYPIEVVYKPTNGESFRMAQLYWEGDELKRRISMHGLDWVAERYREQESEWVRIEDKPPRAAFLTPKR